MSKKKIISIAGALLIALSMNIGKIDAAESLEKTKYQVTSKSLNVRKGPGTKYNVISKVKKGKVLVRYGNDNKKIKKWCKVILSDDVVGWVSTKHLKEIKNIEIEFLNSGKTTAKKLNVRSGPGTKCSVKDKLKKNTEVDILLKTGKWYFVEYKHNGRFATGYVSSSLVKIIK